MAIKKLNHEKDWIQWVKVGFGFTLYILWNQDWQMPLGFVWGMLACRRRFEVFGSYVPHFARRLGIRRAINQQILKHYEIVSTPWGSRDGMAFMRGEHYKYIDKAALWFKRRK